MNRCAECFVLGAAIVFGAVTIAGATPYCPPNCDCEVPKASLASCATSVTQCSGLTPAENPVSGMMECGAAQFVAPPWPADCKKSAVLIDENEEEYYESESNCDKPLTNCRRPTSCKVEYVEALELYVCINDTQYGNWTDERKPTLANCGQ